MGRRLAGWVVFGIFVPAVAFAQTPVLTLEEALRQAAEENPSLVAARARLEQADAQIRKAWAGYLPHLSVGGSYTRNQVEAAITLPTSYYIRDVGQPQGPPFDPTREPGVDNPPGAPTSLIQVPAEFADVTIQKQNQFAAQAELRQAIFAPTLYATIQTTRTAAEIAQLQYTHARRELLFAVAQTYLGAAGLKETSAVQQRLLERVRKQESVARVRVQAGAAPKLDLLRAELDVAEAEQDLVRTRNSLQAAKSGLATLLGRSNIDFDLPSPDQLPPPQQLPAADALFERSQERPDLLAARTSVELAESARRAAIFAYLPQLNLLGRYQIANVEGFTGQPDSYAITLALSWTLWDGGLREAQLREVGAAIAEAKAQLAGAELRAQDDVRRALLEVESARANREKSERRLALAKETLQLVQTSYEAGAATSLDVTNATATLLGAELGYLSESLSAQLATLQALKAAGAFDVTQ